MHPLRRRSRCNFCGKDLLYPSRVQLHIQNAPKCRAKWDKELASRPHLSRATIQQTASVSPAGDDQPMENTHSMSDIELEQLADSFKPSSSTRPPEDDPRPTKRAYVEDIEDEGEQPMRFCRQYPGCAAEILGTGKTEFETIRASQKASDSPDNCWAPFHDSEEWELAEWLVQETTQKARDRYLKMNIVSLSLINGECGTYLR